MGIDATMIAFYRAEGVVRNTLQFVPPSIRISGCHASREMNYDAAPCSGRYRAIFLEIKIIFTEYLILC